MGLPASGRHYRVRGLSANYRLSCPAAGRAYALCPLLKL